LSFDNLAFYAASVDSTAQTGHPGAGDLQEELYQMVKHATIPLALSLLAHFTFIDRISTFCCPEIPSTAFYWSVLLPNNPPCFHTFLR
jgi:hypothetical protein